MSINCKSATGNCPMELTVCCAVCGFKANCGNACDTANLIDPAKCPDVIMVDEDLVAFEKSVPGTLQKITTLVKLKKQMDEQEKQLKAELLKAMEHYGVKSFDNDVIRMTYVAPSTRSTLDGAKLKKDHPDIVKQYTKTSKVAAFVKVELKGGDK